MSAFTSEMSIQKQKIENSVGNREYLLSMKVCQECGNIWKRRFPQ